MATAPSMTTANSVSSAPWPSQPCRAGGAAAVAPAAAPGAACGRHVLPVAAASVARPVASATPAPAVAPLPVSAGRVAGSSWGAAMPPANAAADATPRDLGSALRDVPQLPQ